MENQKALNSTKIITLLTDFGLRDTYVGIMKGVILSICPGVQLIDLTHEIPPQDIRIAAWQLSIAYKYFPAGSIHVAVVDPGVGTSRRSILVTCDGYFFVGPDNGIFSFLYQSRKPFKVYALNQKKFFLETISTTFHGRDIFAPVAGYLACGTPPEKIGIRITDPVILPGKEPKVKNRKLYGEVVSIDHFGNLITNISEEVFENFVKERPFLIKIGDISLDTLQKAYAETAKRVMIGVFGSTRHLEIAEVYGNAARRLKMKPGAPVTVAIKDQPSEVITNKSG